MNNIPKGFLFESIESHISAGKNKKDLVLFYSEKPCVASATFTKNIVKAAPVLISQKNIIKMGRNIRAIIANSRCANACTGKKGLRDAQEMCSLTAKSLNIESNQVLVASTGVIGRFLPMDKLRSGISKLGKMAVSGFCEKDSASGAAQAIMTTDLVPKISSAKFALSAGEKPACIWGCAKGSGMIHPDMATMLCFIFTDANISRQMLNLAFKNIINKSFNCISVDGDTSTNDSAFILANGLAGNSPITVKNNDYSIFYKTLTVVCTSLAKKIAADGEGATKLIKLEISKAKNEAQARKIAKTISTSMLVKTAFYGNDPNWGRIIAAIGRSGVKIAPDKVNISLGKICVFRQGSPANFSPARARKAISGKEVTLKVELNQGNTNLDYYTCDLTDGYIKINAHYTT